MPQKQPISERASLPLRCIPRTSLFHPENEFVSLAPKKVKTMKTNTLYRMRNCALCRKQVNLSPADAVSLFLLCLWVLAYMGHYAITSHVFSGLQWAIRGYYRCKHNWSAHSKSNESVLPYLLRTYAFLTI